jgi:hypothetical protein
MLAAVAPGESRFPAGCQTIPATIAPPPFRRSRRHLIVNQALMSAIVLFCQHFKSELFGLSSMGVTVG